MGGLRSAVFNHVRSDEVPFNYQFGALLGYSLSLGPELVEAIHPEVSLGDEIELVALQDFSTLDDDLGDGPREVDVAFQGPDTILGIESKRADTLSARQLRQELNVLEQNARGRDVVLIAVTEDTEPPSAVTKANSSTEHTVLWNSWHRIAFRFEENAFSQPHDPIRQMVIDLFDDADYTLSFDGFPDPALDSEIYIEWLQQFTNLMYDVETVLQDDPLCLNRSSGNNMPSWASKRTNVLNKSYIQPAAPALFVPFTVDPKESLNNWGNDSHVSLYGNYHDDEVGVFLDLNPMNDGWSEEVLKTHRDEIVDILREYDMLFRVSRNSHAHSNRSPRDLQAREEIVECIDETVGTSDGKRVLIGRVLSDKESPKATVEAVAAELQFCYELFFEDEKLLGQFRS